MDPQYTGRRPLLPRVEPLELGGQPPNVQPFVTHTMPLPPTSRQPKSAVRTDQEWEHQKSNFHRLYIGEDLPLPEVMKRMEEEYHFKAS